MFTKKRHPDYILASELDQYLAQAWYRMGQSIFTCHFLCFGECIYAAIWLRLDLKKHQIRKSQRKLFRKNSRFHWSVQKADLNEEKEELYRKYRWHAFNGNISTSLQSSLLDGGEKNIYNTLECCIYEEDKLIAVSFFDVGEHSISSIMGMYDPDYSEYSLGYYTMLLEIEYAMQEGFQYYYPGYIVPGYARFDYKARIGAVEYFEVSSNNWLSLEDLDKHDFPLQRMKNALQNLQVVLSAKNISSRLYFYPLFEAHIMTMWDANYLKYPIFLWCETLNGQSDYILITYDLVQQTYVLLQCNLFGKLPSFLEKLFEESNNDQPTFLEILIVKYAIFTTNNIEILADELSRLHQLRRLK